MNYFKQLYTLEIINIVDAQRKAGYCEWKINAYLADMEDWINSFHRQHPDGEKFIIGAGLAQDNSRYDLPDNLEIVGIQIRSYDPEENTFGGWKTQDLKHKQNCIDRGYTFREVYAFKEPNP